MWVAYFLNYSDRQVVFSIFPLLKSQLHFNNIELGLTGSVFLWSYCLFSPIAGQLGDRFSKRRLVLASLLLWSGVTIVTGVVNSPRAMLVTRVLIGVTEALFIPSAVALTAAAHGPKTRSSAVSILFTAQMAGVIMGGWYGGFVAEHFGWRWAFYSLGILGAAYGLPYYWGLGRTVDEEVPVRPAAKSKNRWAVFELMRARTFVILCLSFPIYTGLLWLIYTWFPDFLFEKFSLSLTRAGFVSTVYIQSATMVGLLAGGALADRLCQRTKAARFWVVCGGMLFSAPWVYLLANSKTLAYTKLGALGFGFGSGLFVSNFMVSSLDVVSADARASSVGFLNLVGAPVSGFAALFGGVLKDSIGIPAVMNYATLLSLISGLFLVWGVKTYFARDYERVCVSEALPIGECTVRERRPGAPGRGAS